MNLFGKKNEKKSCCDTANCTPENLEKFESKKTEEGIKILGSGCAKCIKLENSVRQALQEMHLELNVEHITDFAQIASYGIMSTPALVINGKVVSYGKVLSIEEIKSLLKQINH